MCVFVADMYMAAGGARSWPAGYSRIIYYVYVIYYPWLQHVAGRN